MAVEPHDRSIGMPGRLTRRSTLAVILGGVGTVAAGALALVVGFLSNALGRKPGRPWERIGAAEDLDDENRLLISFTSKPLRELA